MPELWAHRELLYFLAWRDIKVRYKQTAVGALWAILQPALMMLLFSLIGRVARIPSGDVPYPLFALAGIVPWTFVSATVAGGANSLVLNANLLTKVYFPRLLVPAATVAAGLVDLAVALVLLAGVMAAYGFPVRASQFLLLPLVAVVTVLAFAVSVTLAAWNLKYRDVRHAIPFFIQLWMFASPVLFPNSLVPRQWRWVFALNPLTGLIEAFRVCLFGGSLDWPQLAISLLVTMVVLIGGVISFRRLEQSFADFA